MKNKIILFGTGEISELAYFYFTNDSEYEVVAFCCDKEYIKGDSFCDLPLFSLEEIQQKFPSNKFKMHVALSYSKLNKIREEKYLQVKKMGYNLVNYISSKSFFWNDLKIGDNCFILERAISSAIFSLLFFCEYGASNKPIAIIKSCLILRLPRLTWPFIISPVLGSITDEP